MTDIEQIIGEYKRFFKNLLQRLAALPIKIDGYPIDHCCYRVATHPEYVSVRDAMKAVSAAYVENTHNGRSISKFLLQEPLEAEGYSVPLIELPAPKAGREYPTGLEHFEMVVRDDFPTFRTRYQDLWTGSEDSGPHNKTVFITFDNGLTVKFHEQSLQEVVALEGHSFEEIA